MALFARRQPPKDAFRDTAYFSATEYARQSLVQRAFESTWLMCFEVVEGQAVVAGSSSGALVFWFLNGIDLVRACDSRLPAGNRRG
jgi:hypothetical protein